MQTAVVSSPSDTVVGDSPTHVLHDVRGSLNVIRGQCHAIVRGGRVSDRTIERLRLLDAEIDRIVHSLEIVRHVLDGRHRGEDVARVDMAALVADVVRRHDGLAGERGVVITAISGVGRRMVDGDEDALRRMIDNLVQNAIRACAHQGRVAVRVNRSGSRVVVRIVDDGGGWDGRSILPSGSGWGMGVEIARSIARRHGGTVTHAAHRDGTSVTVALPGAPPAALGA